MNKPLIKYKQSEIADIFESIFSMLNIDFSRNDSPWIICLNSLNYKDDLLFYHIYQKNNDIYYVMN